MKLVQRANVVLEVAEDDIQRFLDMGYNVLNEDGSVAVKAIPTDLGALRRAYIEHEDKIKALETKIADLEVQLKKAKKKPKEVEE